MSAMELMLHQALKALGIKPEQIEFMAGALTNGVSTVIDQNQRILAGQKRLERMLISMGATLPAELELENDGPGNGPSAGGNSSADSDRGSSDGSDTRTDGVAGG